MRYFFTIAHWGRFIVLTKQGVVNLIPSMHNEPSPVCFEVILMKEKIKNKMSVKKKVFISILLIVLSFILGSTIYTFVAPPVYLAVKYDTSPFNYKLDRYDPAIYYFDISYFDYHLTIPTWQYTYKDKELMVQFFDNSFYDDYQMEYLFNESVKQLKKNVDSRIDGFTINNSDSYGIYDSKKRKRLIRFGMILT